MKRYIFIIILLTGGVSFGSNSSVKKEASDHHAVAVADAEKEVPKNDAKVMDKWDFYPNPVVDMLYITGLEGFYTIKIVDAVGLTIATVKGTDSEQQFNLSGRKAGMYLIKIESQGKSFTRKMIKK